MHTSHARGQEICERQFVNAYQRNRETNGAFQKHLYHHQTIQRNTEMLFENDARYPFTILACLPCWLAWCVVWDVLRPNLVCRAGVLLSTRWIPGRHLELGNRESLEWVYNRVNQGVGLRWGKGGTSFFARLNLLNSYERKWRLR